MRSLAIVFAFLIVAVGCASVSDWFTKPTAQQAALRLGVKAATLRLAEKDPAAAIAHIDELRAVLASDGTVVIDQERLTAVVLAVFPGATLEEQLLLVEFSTAVADAASVSLPLGGTQIPVEAIDAALVWAREAAQLALAAQE